MSSTRDRLRKKAAQKAKEILKATPKKDHPNTELIEEGERPCPICGKTMHMAAKNDLIIDLCTEHGIWFDSGELEKILKRAQARSNTKQRLAVSRAIKSIKRESLYSGVFSLLWY